MGAAYGRPDARPQFILALRPGRITPGCPVQPGSSHISTGTQTESPTSAGLLSANT